MAVEYCLLEPIGINLLCVPIFALVGFGLLLLGLIGLLVSIYVPSPGGMLRKFSLYLSIIGLTIGLLFTYVERLITNLWNDSLLFKALVLGTFVLIIAMFILFGIGKKK